MKYLAIINIVLIYCMMASCRKDKGNYDYSPVNEIGVMGIDSVYNLEYGSRVTIRPQLSFTLDTKGDTAKYSYQWISIRNPLPNVYATTKDLDTIVRLAFGVYDFYFRVTDKSTGIFTDANFTVNVSGPSYEGWLLLCDTGDGNSRLDMISRRGAEETVYPDILKQLGSAFPLKGKPAFINCSYTYLSAPPRGSLGVVVATSEKASGLGLDVFDYLPSYDINNLIAAANQITDFTNARLYLRLYSGMMWAENKVYWASSTTLGPVNKLGAAEPLFKPSPFMAVIPNSSNAHTILYNEDTKSFVRYPTAGGTSCLAMAPGTLFDFNTNKDLLYMTYTAYNGGEVFAVLKDPADSKCYLARFTNVAASVQRYYGEINVPEIANATNFTVSPALGYLFYNVGSKVYEYDFNTGKSIMMKDYGSRKISLMKFHYFSTTYSSTPVNTPYYRNLGNKLAVCTYDEGNPKTSGSLDLFTVPDINAQIQLYQSFTGVGKVMSLSYRER